MTAADELRAAADNLEKLAEGPAGYEGDPQWCPEWTYTAVRHVQRNMDIECPTHTPWNGPDRIDECGRWGRYDGQLITTMRSVVDPLIAWLRREADEQDFSSTARDPEIPRAIASAILSGKASS